MELTPDSVWDTYYPDFKSNEFNFVKGNMLCRPVYSKITGLIYKMKYNERKLEVLIVLTNIYNNLSYYKLYYAVLTNPIIIYK